MNFEERFKTIKRTLLVLIAEGSIAELRVPKSEGGPKCGLFSDLSDLATAAAQHSGKAPGIFIGLNPVIRILHASDARFFGGRFRLFRSDWALSRVRTPAERLLLPGRLSAAES